MVERIRLGRTELFVSRVCFGCWQMGGSFWGDTDEQALTQAVHKAIDLGVNFFDTADAYGDGFAESMLGRMLAGKKRDELVLATKVYHHPLEGPGSRRVGDLSYDYIQWECEQSLKRLDTDYIDLYQAHSFDQFTHLEETVAAFEKLKQAGKIRHYGCSNFNAEQLRAALRFGSFDTLQPRYNLMDRRLEADLLPLCMSENLGVLTYSSLEYGLLTGKFDGTETFTDLRENRSSFTGEAFRENVAKVNRLKAVADDLGVTVTQLAIRFILDHPAVHCAIVGIKNEKQITEGAGAMDWQLSREQYYRVRDTFDKG